MTLRRVGRLPFCWARSNTKAATEVWKLRSRPTWNRPPVWIHGDVSAGNLLVKEGAIELRHRFWNGWGLATPHCDLSICLDAL